MVILPQTSAGTIVVTKYNDLNGNGQRDATEPALEGWTFTLRNAAGIAIATATTGADGKATFPNVTFGSYTVLELTKAGWLSSDPGGLNPTKALSMTAPTVNLSFGNFQPRLPSTSTAAATEEGQSTALLTLGAILLAQGLLMLLVFRRWRRD